MAERPGDGQTLLLVEDDLRTLAELERTLGRLTSFRILAAEGPAEALEFAAMEVVDIALLDVRLPGMDGLTLLGRLRERRPDLLALVMTGYREETTARESRERGAVDFLEKPLDLPYLLTVLGQQSRECRLLKELRSTAARLRRILDRTGDGLALMGPEGALLGSNALGEDLVRACASQEEGQVAHGGRVFEFRRTTEAGETLLHWSDVTEALEAERGAAYRRMSRLLAHELSNPLTPMRLWLQELKAVPPGDPGLEALCRQAVEVLLGQVDRLARLVGRFKRLGEEEAIEVVPVDLAKVAGEAMRLLDPWARSLGVMVEGDLSGELVVRSNEAALSEVLFNLLKNAVEAQAGREGRVILRAESASGAVEVGVLDEGGGLPPEVAASPFTPYLTTKDGGTGLGLLVCRDLLARLGSQLILEDRRGEGLTARFTLRSACHN